MYKYPLRSVILALLAGISIAAMPEVRWLEKDYDFGLIKEISGPKTGVSKFVNAGKDTLSIIEVRPSCGCTSAEYFEGMIAPGDTAWINYTYDPTMRPGKFDKSVRVRLSDGSKPVIKIRGNVLGTPESLATLYPVDGGEIRLSDDKIDFGEVCYGRQPMNFVNLYSVSLDTIVPEAKSTPRAIRVRQSEKKAGPGDIVTFSIGYDSLEDGEYGPREYDVRIEAGTEGEALVKVMAFVVPDGEQLRLRQNGRNPGCDLRPDPLDFGADIGNDVLSTAVDVQNTGKGELEILSVSNQSPAIIIGKYPAKIKAGKKGKIKVELDPSQLAGGPFRTYIDIVCNDPDRPHRRIAVCGFKK